MLADGVVGEHSVLGCDGDERGRGGFVDLSGLAATVFGDGVLDFVAVGWGLVL